MATFCVANRTGRAYTLAECCYGETCVRQDQMADENVQLAVGAAGQAEVLLAAQHMSHLKRCFRRVFPL